MEQASASIDAGELHLFFAPTPRGLADLTAQELRALGIEELRERDTGVQFRGTLRQGYQACLWSRTASRVLLQLARFEAATTAAFEQAVHGVDWRPHIDPAGTIACEFAGQHPTIVNTHFGALKLKDGICDQLRETTGRRPDVEPQRPAVRIHAHAQGSNVGLYLDMAGEGLHRRGYRAQAGEAPLRENVAAGVLMRAGWPAMAAQGQAFLDPLCGSGTLVIEAALIAAGRAPGVQRDYWGFAGWLQHDAALWQSLCDEATAQADASLAHSLRGSDRDAAVLRVATANAQRAGVADLIGFTQGDVADTRPAAPAGLVCTNPPYGTRLGDEAAAREVHRQLGTTLREHFSGWEAAILTAAPGGARELGLRTYRTHELWNGAILVRLLRIELASAGVRERPAGHLRIDPALADSPGAKMFANRLGKNLQRLKKLAQRAGVSCYRLYDADMPEYSFAIDLYAEAASGLQHLYVQEYAAPASIEAAAVARRRGEAFSVLSAVTGVPGERLHLRTRKRQSGTAQYERLATREQFTVVEEQGLKFLINFSDYLDTGLFLDHRLTRQRLRTAAAGGRFLNLFCYTASATVQAAAGGATRSVSVDMSNTYLEWAAENLRLNGLATTHHELVRADCRRWLDEAAQRSQRFELIFLDPPTFSNSRRMEGVLDTQRDHAELIDACMRLLAPGGLLVFSTNAQKFKLDAALGQRYQVLDISAATIPFDFERNPRIHRCFELRRH